VISTGVRAIRVFGTRYRCRLRYAHVHSLDPLSGFVLDVIRRAPQYARIEVLARSFGLPVRIMEDVLADLVRTRNAWLDLARGVLVPINASSRTGVQYEDRGILDVWQDHATGAILPASIVAPCAVPQDGAETLRRRTEDQFVSFLDASDATLRSALVRIDPTLAFSGDGTWRLDRFVNRARLGAYILWIPVRASVLGDTELLFVEAMDLPTWLVKAWTVLLRRDRPLQSVVAEAAKDGDIELSVSTALQHAQLPFYASRWLESAQEHLDLIPPPESPQDVRTFEQTFARLQERLLSLVRVCVSTGSLLNTALKNATDSALLAVSNLTAEAEPWFSETTRLGRHQTVIVHGEPITQAKPSALRHVRLPGWKDEFALIDGSHLWLPMTKLAREGPVLEVVGRELGRNIQGLLERVREVDGDGALPVFDPSTAEHSILVHARTAGGTLNVRELLSELSEFRRHFSLAMQDRRLQRSKDSTVRGEGTVDGLVRTAEDVPTLSIASSHPSLATRLDKLRRDLVTSLEPGNSAFAFIQQREILDLLDLIVIERPGASNVCRIMSHLSECSLEDDVIEALQRGIANGWQFNIYAPDSNEQLEYAQRLRARLPSVHIRFFAAPTFWTAGIVIMNDLLIAGTFQILADRSAVRVSQAFAVVLQDGAAGERLIEERAMWPEITRL